MPKLHITIHGELNGMSNGEIVSAVAEGEQESMDALKFALMDYIQTVAPKLRATLETQEAKT